MKTARRVGRALASTRKGVCYLTHGADTYDHRALKKALRMVAQALVLEGVEEAEEAPEARPVAPKPAGTVYRLVIVVQGMEDYGSRWKCKFGGEYHLEVGTLDVVTRLGFAGLRGLVDKIRPHITTNGDSFYSYIIDWEVLPAGEYMFDEECSCAYNVTMDGVVSDRPYGGSLRSDHGY